MILARLWQVVVGVVVAGALALAALTVAVFDRRESRRAEELAVAQMQTVRRVIENDARRSLDALAFAAVNDDTQKALAALHQNAGGKEKDAVFRALSAAVEKIPSEVRGDAHVLLDRDGTVVTYLAFRELDSASVVSFGAAPTVVDALHGYVRDDLWVLGGKLFRVVARPVEDDSSHPPLGAVLSLTRLDGSYAQRVAERTGVSFAFFSAGQLAGKGAAQGFDAAHFDDAVAAFAGLAADESFTTTGASKPSPIARGTVAIFSKLPGDAWDLDAGFVVLREQAPLVDLPGVFAAITDDDKKVLPLPLLAGVIALLSCAGLALLWLEHDKPLKRFAEEAVAFQQGKAPRLQLPSLTRTHRAIAEAINETIDRLAETTSAGPRRAADLQSIVGAPASSSGLSAFHVAPVPAPAAPPPPPPSPLSASGVNAGLFGSSQSAPIVPSSIVAAPPPPPPPPPPPVRASAAPPRAPSAPPPRPQFSDDDEENTMLAEQRSVTSNGSPAQIEMAEWRAVYEEFVKTKQSCGETIEGLSFEKFQNTLRKNRDSIRARYQCERVKFTVYVKEGRASLKASPVRNEG